MLTEQEEKFIEYWSHSRTKKKKFLKQFSIAFPVSVLLAILLFVNVISGWHKQASMVIRANSSLIIVILVATVAIVVFISIFSSNYKWEQNEQRYKELLAKQSKFNSG
jgi:uncharacterized membrane protein